jgi:hypothetical protein
MKLRPHLVAAFLVGGCSLINSKTFSYDYAFDPQEFSKKLGDEKVMQNVPAMACDPNAAMDVCAQLQAGLPATASTLQCDPASKMCIAVVELSLPYKVDLSMAMTPLPADVVQYGANAVSIDKVAYWIMTNTVNVTLPPVDLYVASAAAKDQNDPSAVKIGSVASPHGATCGDTVDTKGDPAAGTAVVCDVSLTDAGQAALATFVKSYKTPFQLIAHTRFTVPAGQPLPTGTLDFFVRPTVAFSILK